MAVRVAINGFGRTGRAAFRAAYERETDIEWVAINDLADPEMLAQLLKHDTVYGPFAGTGRGRRRRDRRRRRHASRCRAETDPAKLPWDELDVDVVIESTGRFRARADAAKHLEAGARKVIISAPAKEPDVTVALGVNFDEVYDPEAHRIISNASCTTNCLAPVAKVIHEALRNPARPDDDRARVHRRPAAARRAAQGLPARARGGLQPRADDDRRREGARAGRPRAGRQAPGLRRSRAGADRIAGRPHGRGRAADDGRRGERRSSRVAPTSASSRASSPTARSRSSRRDIVKSPYSAIFDAGLTAVIDGTQVKVVAWYDNEWGYSNRLVELAQRVIVPALAEV